MKISERVDIFIIDKNLSFKQEKKRDYKVHFEIFMDL